VICDCVHFTNLTNLHCIDAPVEVDWASGKVGEQDQCSACTTSGWVGNSWSRTVVGGASAARASFFLRYSHLAWWFFFAEVSVVTDCPQLHPTSVICFRSPLFNLLNTALQLAPHWCSCLGQGWKYFCQGKSVGRVEVTYATLDLFDNANIDYNIIRNWNWNSSSNWLPCLAILATRQYSRWTSRR
jgi:hypothetical protein